MQIEGLQLREKFEYSARDNLLELFYIGVRDRTNTVACGDNQRGLTREQKLIVGEATDSKKGNPEETWG